MSRKKRSPRTKSSRQLVSNKATRPQLGFEQLENRLALAVVINEFMADNSDGIRDFSGERHDWIELKNTGPATLNVSGWYLTDDASNLTKWQIPATAETQSLAPGGVLLVYASDKNGTFSGELHANFRLAIEGEYLALVRGDGSTIEDAFDPYPAQVTDVSYGRGVNTATTTTETLVGSASPLRVISPSAEDAARDDHWREIDFDDSGWLAGTRSIGFDRNGGTGGNFSTYIGRPLTAGEMPSSQFTAYVRYEFEVADKDQLSALQLDMRFDDGVVIYLNGREYDRINAGIDFARPKLQWDSRAGYQLGSSSGLAATDRSSEALIPVTFDLTAYLPELVNGTNVLAFHVLNGSNSSAQQDLLLEAVLTATRATTEGEGYMPAPTPGGANGLVTLGFVEDTNFSFDRGFYNAPFQLEITTATPGATIRYTTDGSVPSLSNGSTYSGPINIGTTTTLRAAAFKDGWTSTNVDTQTYVFLADVIGQDSAYVTQPYATWGHDDPADSGSETGYHLDDESDWDMDPEIVGGLHTAQEVIDALSSIPTMSIVMDWNDLFGGTPMPGTPLGTTTVSPAPQGIYIHGRSDERSASLEYFNPSNADDQFQVDAAIETQGHSSLLRWNSDKLSFEVKFKSPYGDTSLDYPLFAGTPDGENAVTHFDNLILDAQFNYSWLHQNTNVQANYATYITDQVMSDLQNLASNGGHHGRWVHLYLNGLYWGVYNAHERPTDALAAEYYGGDKDDYYVIKHANNDVNHEFTWSDGGIAAELDFMNLLDAARAVSANPTNAALYSAVEEILDIDQFIDYMIVHYYGGGGNDWSHNNWYASRNSQGGKWRFHAWDQEHAFPNNANPDGWTQLSDLTGQDNFETSTEIHRDLIENANYRLRFADRVQELMYNGGVLTTSVAAAAYQARVNEVSLAMIAESARWGDNRAATPYDQSDFLANTAYTINQFFPVRTNTVLGQFASAGWIPSLAAPLFSQYGGEITPGFDLTLSKPAGSPGGAVIYYTTDGSDPRNAATNLPSSNAVQYTGPIDLVAGAQVKARIYFNNSGAANDWSPVVDKTFLLDEPLPLRIVEIMYNPPGSGDDTEYLELLNTGSEVTDLTGVRITEFSAGGFMFSSGTLNPGERIVVVKDQVAFAAAYPGVTNVAPGEFSGSLANEGELISLRGPLGELLQSFTYGDSNIPGWPEDPDGEGYSLEYIGPLNSGENPLDVSPADPFDNPANWRASLVLGGTPGTDGSVNEPDSADFDGDGDVDGRDFLAWQRGYGKPNAAKTDGDANNDGTVNGTDLGVWQDQYGTQPPLSALVASDVRPTAVLYYPSPGVSIQNATSAVADELAVDSLIAVDQAFSDLPPIALPSDSDWGDIAVCRDRTSEDIGDTLSGAWDGVFSL